VVDREVAGGELAPAVGALAAERFLNERAEFRKSVVELLPGFGSAMVNGCGGGKEGETCLPEFIEGLSRCVITGSIVTFARLG
jgi:hypothetical protein